MNITTSNERELNVDELNIVSGGGLFSLLLRISAITWRPRSTNNWVAPDVKVGLPK
jgi:hypothetical protein